mgnify:FL=1
MVSMYAMVLLLGRTLSWSEKTTQKSFEAAQNKNRLQELESRGLLQAQRTAGRTVTADGAALHALRRRRAQTLAGEFLHQMHALSLTETEIETLLRETAQQQTEE